MYECRFDIAELPCVVAALAEIRVLVYSAGNETGDLGNTLLVGAEDEGKGSGEGGGGLHGWEGKLSNVVTGYYHQVNLKCRICQKMGNITCH